jgi:hypothetical protein
MKKKFTSKFVKEWIGKVRDSMRKQNYADATLQWEAKQKVTDKPYDPYVYANIEAAKKLLAERAYKGISIPYRNQWLEQGYAIPSKAV